MAIKTNFQKFLETIGTNLHKTRVSQNLSITAVAKAVKASRITLCRIERGDYNLKIELLGRLCKLYKVTAGDMATEKKPLRKSHHSRNA